MTNNIEQETEKVIQEFTDDGHMFTALDISNEVKTRLPGVRHREVAPVVRDLFTAGRFAPEYAQTMIKVQIANGSHVDAFLYHDEEDDPDDYAGNQRKKTAKAPAAVRYVPPGQPVPAAMQPQPSTRNNAPIAQAPVPPPASANTSNLKLRVGPQGELRLPKQFIENTISTRTVHLERGDGSKFYLRDDRSQSPDAELEYDGAELVISKQDLAGVFDAGQVVTAAVVGFVIELS